MVLISQILHATPLLTAIEQVESGGNAFAVGDSGKAIGILQIHQCVLDDINRANGMKFRHYAMRDPHLSRIVFYRYIELWATEARIGRAVTDEDMARIWNGGPDGWKKESTLVYWHKVKIQMEKITR
jgi:hypothetical protein